MSQGRRGKRRTVGGGGGRGKMLLINLQVKEVILRDGTHPADMVVVGIGVRPNSGLFAEQLDIDWKGSIKVNGRMQTSNNSVYAVGDVAAFPVKLFGNNVRRRLEHVDSARRTARHAVAAIMAPETTGDLDYLPFFYSRVFTLSWQFYGDNVGKVVHYGDFSDDGRPFGAYWVDKGHIVGAFLEGGSKEEYEAIAKTVKLKMPVRDDAELGRAGVEFAMRMIEQQQAGTGINSNSSMEKDQKPPLMHPWHATAGVVVALSVAAFACWYQRYCRR